MGKVLEYQGVAMNGFELNDNSSMSGVNSSVNTPFDTIRPPNQDSNHSVIISAPINNHGLTRTVDFDARLKSFNENTEQEQAQIRKKHDIATIVLSCLVVLSSFYLKQPCPFESESDCLANFISPRIYLWIALITFNGLAARFQLEFLLSKLTNSKIGVVSFAVTMLLFMFSDNEITPKYYMGVFNLLNLFAFVVFFVLFRAAKALNSYLMASPLICTLICIGIIILTSLFVYEEYVKKSCDYQQITIGSNASYDSSLDVCEIIRPDICWDSLAHGWQDLSYWFSHSTCTKQLLPDSPFLSSDTIPRYAAYSTNSSMYSSQQSALSSVEHFNQLSDAILAGKEIILDESKMQYHIQVSQNMELAVKNLEVSQSVHSLAKSILIISVDGFSRASMHLKLPNTIDWFAKHSNSRKTAEFYRYNQHPVSKDEATINERIINDLKAAGFMTGIASDTCSDASVNADHTGVGFSCDPNYLHDKNHHNLSQGPSSMVRRCLYQQDISAYMFTYANSFMKTYKNQNKKVFELRFNYNSDRTGEVINHLDDPLVSFLQGLLINGDLEESVVILHSDSGNHHRGIFESNSNAAENNLPGLFISLPPSFKESSSSNIQAFQSNQAMLTTPVNLHHFIKHVAIGEKYSQKQLSLLSSLHTQLQCSDVDIPESYCSCV